MGNVVAIGMTTHGKDGRPESLQAELDVIVAAGADAAELALYDLDLVAGGRVLEGRFGKVMEIIQRYPLRFTVHGPIASNPWDLRHAEIHAATTLAYLEMTGRLGAKVYVQHSGRIAHVTGPELAALQAHERDYLRRMGDVAGRLGITIAVENLFGENPGDLTQLPHEVALQVERLDHPQVAVLIDFSHAYLEAMRRGVDPWASCRQAGPWTSHLHLHDSFGRPQTLLGYTRSEMVAFGMGDLHLPLGWGDIPWTELFGDLEVRPGTIGNVELPGRYFDVAAECVAQARQIVGLGR